jgi:hypothetical protein
LANVRDLDAEPGKNCAAMKALPSLGEPLCFFDGRFTMRYR